MTRKHGLTVDNLLSVTYVTPQAQIKSVDEPRTWRFTNHIHKAMKFDDFMMAYDFYKTQSARRPFRSDGNPNRPLSLGVCASRRAPSLDLFKKPSTSVSRWPDGNAA